MAKDSPTPRQSSRTFLLVSCGLVGIVLNCWIATINSGSWDVDFNQYYSAGKLVGSGHLYDRAAIESLELQHTKAVPFGRIPAFALAFRPLSLLPYEPARAVWLVIGVAALAGFVWLWPLADRAWAVVAICWSAPAAMCLSFGQDSVLFLFFATVGIRLLIAERDFWSGVAISACIGKPHLALLFPVLMIARGRWRAVFGGVAGVAASVLISFAAEGRDWIQQLVALSRIPEFDPAAQHMPNLRGLLSFTSAGLGIEAAIGVVVAAAIFYLSQRQSLAVAGALVISAGLMLGHHGYFYDAVLLLPALLLTVQTPHPEWLRGWALLLFTPLPFMMLLTSLGLAAQIALNGFTLALITMTLMSTVMQSPSRRDLVTPRADATGA
jgi:hypothetical protein